MGNVSRKLLEHKAQAIIIARYDDVARALHAWRDECFLQGAAIIHDARQEGRELTPEEMKKLADLGQEQAHIAYVCGALSVDPSRLGVQVRP
jgi:hypothetical protein